MNPYLQYLNNLEEFSIPWKDSQKKYVFKKQFWQNLAILLNKTRGKLETSLIFSLLWFFSNAYFLKASRVLSPKNRVYTVNDFVRKSLFIGFFFWNEICSNNFQDPFILCFQCKKKNISQFLSNFFICRCSSQIIAIKKHQRTSLIFVKKKDYLENNSHALSK